MSSGVRLGKEAERRTQSGNREGKREQKTGERNSAQLAGLGKEEGTRDITRRLAVREYSTLIEEGLGQNSAMSTCREFGDGGGGGRMKGVEFARWANFLGMGVGKQF